MAFRTVAPAKLNLSLAVTGRRQDGFHELLGIVAPLELSDVLEFSPGPDVDSLACDDPTVPLDGSNLVLRAAAALRRRVFGAPAGRWTLSKRIPHGAGLGGGSSDAAGALRLLNQAAGSPLGGADLREVAAEVGSDCAMFVEPAAAVIRGRGELVELLPTRAAASLSGRVVLLAKPSWGVATPDAYGWLAAQGRYSDPGRAESALARALSSGDPLSGLVALGNDLQAPVVRRHPALGAGLARLSRELGLPGLMTGSGSACFWVGGDSADLARVRALLEADWGPGVWVARSRLA